MRVISFGELVASVHEEGAGAHEFNGEPRELAFVFFNPRVVRIGHNWQVVAVSTRHHKHSLSKSLVRFSKSVKSLSLCIEIFELGSLDRLEHFI